MGCILDLNVLRVYASSCFTSPCDVSSYPSVVVLRTFVHGAVECRQMACPWLLYWGWSVTCSPERHFREVHQLPASVAYRLLETTLVWHMIVPSAVRTKIPFSSHPSLLQSGRLGYDVDIHVSIHHLSVL